MNTLNITFITTMVATLVACSSSDTTEPMNDAIDALNFRTKLATALTYSRADYYQPFLEAPAIANQLFAQPLPDATDYFGPNPFPTGTETASCEAGSVERNVTASDAAALTINATFSFTDCQLQGSVYNGSIELFLSGDSPSRLGGQVGRVNMVFNNMETKNGEPPASTNTLDGSFDTQSGFGGPNISYRHEYVTQSYQRVGDFDDFTINNASYTQTLDSSHLDGEAYYRLSESGSLNISGLIGQTDIDYAVSISPEVVYTSKLNENNLPVYDDDLLSGEIIYTESMGGSITVSQDDNDTAMVLYEVYDGTQSFSEVDEWLYPIDCVDSSPMNKRDICQNRR